MIVRAAIFFSILGIIPVFSQQLKINTHKFYEGDFVFSKSYILENKIKTVNADIANKPDNQVIEDRGLTKGYEFNDSGLLTRYYSSVIKSSLKREVEIPAVYRKGRIISKAHTQILYTYLYDTISTRYYYDTIGQMIIKRTKYGEIYNSWYYEYNLKGMLSKQINVKETNVNISESDFKLGVQTFISKEEFEYETLSETQFKIKCLNDEGRLYKTIIINKDKNGKVINEYHEYLVGGIMQEYIYEYNETGRLTKRRYTSNESGSWQEEAQFIYDDNQQLMSEIKMKNGVKTNELSFLYDESTGSFKSQLDRDFINKSIGIIKYSYNYHE